MAIARVGQDKEGQGGGGSEGAGKGGNREEKSVAGGAAAERRHGTSKQNTRGEAQGTTTIFAKILAQRCLSSGMSFLYAPIPDFNSCRTRKF